MGVTLVGCPLACGVPLAHRACTYCYTSPQDLGDLALRGTEDDVHANFKTTRKLMAAADKIGKRIK